MELKYVQVSGEVFNQLINPSVMDVPQGENGVKIQVSGEAFNPLIS